jgi:hypothetical protein
LHDPKHFRYCTNLACHEQGWANLWADDGEKPLTLSRAAAAAAAFRSQSILEGKGHMHQVCYWRNFQSIYSNYKVGADEGKRGKEEEMSLR